MGRRINILFVFISAVCIAGSMFVMSVVCLNAVKEQVLENLKIIADTIYNSPQNLLMENIENIDIYDGEIRATLIDGEGTVLYDSDADAGIMDNHSTRIEVQEAKKHGFGAAFRDSETFEGKSFYYARQLQDKMIVRLSKSEYSQLDLYINIFPFIVGVGTVMCIICTILAYFLKYRVIGTGCNILLGSGAYSAGLSGNSVYDELAPVMETIRSHHENILKDVQMRQEFTTNVTHELKTPLTSILGYSELIEQEMVSGDEIKEISTKIKMNSERLLSMINNVIRLSELDGTKEKVLLGPVQLNDVALNCVNMLKINAVKSDVNITYMGQPVSIIADRGMIEELVMNLCDNAIRYNRKKGRVIVSTYTEDGRGVLSVEDTGIGIPETSCNRVFERFYRVDKSRSKESGGTGLGLAIVKHIVAIHKADIELNSKEGSGTTVKVIF